MYILQIADLHIGSPKECSKKESEIVEASIRKIREMINDDKEICLVINGDIIDSSEGVLSEEQVCARYEEAVGLLSLYKDKLADKYQLSYVFSIGNHDITHQKEYLKFVRLFDDKLNEDDIVTQYRRDYEKENLSMIIVNSCSHNQYEKGLIDYEGLEKCLQDIPPANNKILVMHHTVMSMDEDDNSSLRNAAKLMELINNYNIGIILHGHIHGREIISVGNYGCKLIGVGALFSRQYTDVNSQLNVISYHKGVINSIFNLRYIFDSPDWSSAWSQLDINIASCECHLQGSTWKDVYIPLLERLESNRVLYNMTLNIRNTYSLFCKDIESTFEKDGLCLGGKHCNYIQLAEKWENAEIPQELYFNHGSKFVVNGKPGIEYIADQLKNKSTSSRAVLSTSNTKYIIKSYDDEKVNMLPSLLSIQFSKDAMTMYVHMHLRALEAERFLKINICEIYFLLKELKRLGIDFTEVDIVISSFRVQVKKKFSCFIKSQLDSNQRLVNSKVAHKDIETLCSMLEEKKEFTETIIHSEGIINLYESIKLEKAEDPHIYPDSILLELEEIIRLYAELDELHGVYSVKQLEEENREEELSIKIGKVIELLRGVS